MKKQSLNGSWLYRIGKGEEKARKVPFSAHPVGHSECRKIFDISERSPKTFLKFDGITYLAKITLNGVFLGEMTAYSEYTFDVTGIIRDKSNELLVELEDLSPAFGPTAGWENFGGIIRDVYLLFSEETYIKDVFFHSELKNGYRDALYTVETDVSLPEGAETRVSLTLENVTVDSFTAPASVKKHIRSLSDVKLWSTDTPKLYKLNVSLILNGRTVDTYSCDVGFREIKCDRHRFIINGEPVFLQGVCRHEIYGEYGHTVSDELIERDLRIIKDSDCNFVRLVHYPHCKRTLEIADRIGLMVSEEPGLWWSDTENPEVSEKSLEVLKRTVLRDRNHPSVAFWLCFNECRFTEQYLKDAARVCRENDPTRLVSGANCMSNEDTLKYYNACGFDFYTMHPYSDTFERARESARILNDKPLLFTEWGGYFVYDNPHLISDFIHEIYALYKADSDEGAVAGAFFWYFAEVNDFGRERPACVDGVLKEALLDIERRPTLIYDAFCKAWTEAKTDEAYADKYYFEPLDTLSLSPLTYVSGGSDFSEFFKLIAASDSEKIKYNGMRQRRLLLGPVLLREEVPGIAKTPYVLLDKEKITFKCGWGARALTLLGAVSAPLGYPLGGEYGEVAANVTVSLSNGKSETLPLRNGIEFTTVFTTSGSSRIAPVAEKATPFARFGYERNSENYIMNKLVLPLSESCDIDTVTVEAVSGGYGLMIYGIYA